MNAALKTALICFSPYYSSLSSVLTEVNGAYAVRRCLLESIVGGSDYFSTEGVVVRATLPDGQVAIQNRVNFEGWRHDRSSDNDRMAITNGEAEIVYERGAD